VRSLELESEIVAVCETTTIHFLGSGMRGVFRLSQPESTRDAIRLLSLLGRSNRVMRFLHDVCSAQEIDLTVEMSGQTILQMGNRSRPGLFSRILGLYPAEIKILPLVSLFVEATPFSRSKAGRK